MYESGGEDRPVPRMMPAVRAILALNVAVLFLQKTTSEADITRWLAFDAAAGGSHPWTVLTYMFTHAGVWHFLSNMWLLWMFGPRVEEALGTRRFVFYYLWCGLGGWLAHLLLAPHVGLLGASAAVLGVLLAYAVRWPYDEVQVFPLFITLQVRWLVAIFAAINLLFGITTAGGGAGVAYFAHLGGMASGAVFLWAVWAPGLDRVRQRVASVPDEPDEPPRAIPRQPTRTRERTSVADDVVARSKAVAPPATPARGTPLADRIGKDRTEALDRVLDKISRLGLESLTPSERTLLEEMSRRLRDR